MIGAAVVLAFLVWTALFLQTLYRIARELHDAEFGRPAAERELKQARQTIEQWRNERRPR